LIGPVLAALWLAGCGGREPAPIPAAPQRIICASPAMVEIVFALECGGLVAGVSEFTDWPPEAADKPGIGGALAPSRERILALKPDLILAQGRAEALAGFAQSHGIAFRSFPLDTLADLRAAIAGCAAMLGAEARADQLLRDMEAGFAALPRGEPVPVFLALGHAPGDFSGLMTTGPGTFLHELAERAGGSNVFADVRARWPKVSQESIIRRAPELILDIQSGTPDDARRAALVADWERLGFDASRVRMLEGDVLLRPGPRAAQAAAGLSHAIRLKSTAP
jgi:iron complex transport system substrate-binding protein